jgi:hypothetical protein
MKASGMLAIRIRIFHQRRFNKKTFYLLRCSAILPRPSRAPGTSLLAAHPRLDQAPDPRLARRARWQIESRMAPSWSGDEVCSRGTSRGM